MYVIISRDSKSIAFAGAQPRAHPPFGVRALPKYAAKRRTETDNRREAVAMAMAEKAVLAPPPPRLPCVVQTDDL